MHLLGVTECVVSPCVYKVTIIITTIKITIN
jgi:hypothetical protein